MNRITTLSIFIHTLVDIFVAAFLYIYYWFCPKLAVKFLNYFLFFFIRSSTNDRPAVVISSRHSLFWFFNSMVAHDGSGHVVFYHGWLRLTIMSRFSSDSSVGSFFKRYLMHCCFFFFLLKVWFNIYIFYCIELTC